MKKQHSLPTALGLLVLFSMVLAACAPAAAPAPVEQQQPTVAAPTAGESVPAATPTSVVKEEVGKKVLRIAYGQENDTLNSFTSQMTGEVTLPMIEGLVISNNENTYIPVLAKEIPTYENGGVVDREDGKIDMTWNLRQGVKWHDGVEFTADDVCFTWQWLISDGATMVYNQGDYKHISDCKVVDPYTVVFTWDVPFAPYATLFDALLPKHLLEGKDIATYDAYNSSPTGTGAFKFAEWKAGQYIRLVKNDDYWRGSDYPMVDEIIYYFIPDPNTRLNGIKAGEYDFAELGPDMAPQAAGIDGYRTEVVERNIWVHFGFSTQSEVGAKLFSDKAVRQALFYAIDRESIVNDLMEGTVTLANTPLTPSSPYHNADVTAYNYNLEKAAQMLDDAGWKVGSDGIREKDGTRFSFTILANSGRPERVKIAEVFQAFFKQVGVEMNIKTVEAKAYIEQWVSGDWDATIGGWILPADPSFTGIYSCNGSNNMTGLCSEELDAVMEKADQTLDFADRKPLIDEAQAMLADEAFDLPIYYQASPFVMRENFAGFKGSGTNIGSFWNTYEWDLQ